MLNIYLFKVQYYLTYFVRNSFLCYDLNLGIKRPLLSTLIDPDTIFLYIRIDFNRLITKRHQEIGHIHPPVAPWLQARRTHSANSMYIRSAFKTILQHFESFFISTLKQATYQQVSFRLPESMKTIVPNNWFTFPFLSLTRRFQIQSSSKVVFI